MGADTLSRMLCETLNLRAYTVTSIDMVREITGLHRTTPNATIALGRAINAAALLSATLKPSSDQNLLMKIQGTGPIREIHVQADARGNIRGYVANPQMDLMEDFDAISVSKSIGAGILTIRKDIGLREPYTSVVPLNTGDIAGDLAAYLSVSEQIPSALIIALMIEKDGRISSSGGILIQAYPKTPEKSIILVEKNIIAMENSLGDRLKAGADIRAVLSGLLENEPIQILDTYPIRTACRCGKPMIREILKSLSLVDLNDMHAKDKGAEITCSFCTKKYFFNENELQRIILEKAKPSGSDESAVRNRKLH
jgi:molecular chaperone Hsp33